MSTSLTPSSLVAVVPPRPRRRVLWRSLAVGALATVADLGSLALLVSGLGVAAAVANVPSLLAGLVVQFIGNKWWAFQDRSPNLVRQGTLFLLVEVGAFALNAAAFHALVTWALVPYLVARVAGSAAVYLAFSYPLWRLIFKEVSS